MRRPSNVIAEPVPEHSPPPRTSIEDREPRPYSSGGSWSRRSNGRDQSASIGSPPRPTPEIWKPSSNESASSRPLVHATVGTTKTRRDSSASIGTTSSFPATIPEDASLGTDKDQDSEKLWSGIFRSRQKARKGSAASMDDRVTVSQLFPDFKRDDSAITTSPLTPDSPYGIARHPSHTVSSGRQTVNTSSAILPPTPPISPHHSANLWFCRRLRGVHLFQMMKLAPLELQCACCIFPLHPPREDV